MKHAKAFLVLQRIYEVFQAEKIKAVEKARRAWSHWKIIFYFKRFLKKRFGDTRTLSGGKFGTRMANKDARMIKRTRWCMNAFAAINHKRHSEAANEVLL